MNFLREYSGDIRRQNNIGTNVIIPENTDITAF